MKKPSAWALARAEKEIRIEGHDFIMGAEHCSVDTNLRETWRTLREQRLWFAKELDRARQLGVADALRVLNQAAREFEQKGEDGVAFACRSVGKYVKAVA